MGPALETVCRVTSRDSSASEGLSRHTARHLESILRPRCGNRSEEGTSKDFEHMHGNDENYTWERVKD